MAFKNWQIGLHIQSRGVLIAALRHERSGWSLRRWWRVPLAEGIVEQGLTTDIDALVNALQAWRRELPIQHLVRLAFPAGRTLQKALPRPQISLRENEQAQWIASTMARQLAMPASSLCVDYAADASRDGWRVTAAQHQDIDNLCLLARRLRLRVAGIVPDACALASFFPWLPAGVQGLAWRDNEQWLWAMADSWGSCPQAQALSFSQLAAQITGGPLCLCASPSTSSDGFDPWRVIHHLQPPLPERGDDFTIALGLALGAAASCQ